MSAYVHVIPDEEYEILQKYLDEGAVLVRQSVAEEIREKMTFHFCSHVDEVLKLALLEKAS